MSSPLPSHLYAQALAAHQRGDLSTAFNLYRDALTHDPSNADILHKLGLLAQQMGNGVLALQFLDAAQPSLKNDPVYWTNRAIILRAKQRIDEAKTCLETALTLHPRHAEAWDLSAQILTQQHNPLTAVEHHKKAIHLSPHHAAFYASYAQTLLTQGHPSEAYTQALHAYHLSPDNSSLILGHALKACGYPRQAIAYYADAARQLPHITQLAVNEGLARLTCGDDRKGLELFEKRPDVSPLSDTVPPWNGQETNHLVLYEDQGLGDALFAFRWVKLARSRVNHLTILTSPALQPLFQDPSWHVTTTPQTIPLPPTARARMMSLPYILGTEKEPFPPAACPYITPILTSDRAWHSEAQRPSIGLVWGGNPNNPVDRQRSMTLREAIAITSLAPRHFVSLQMGRPEEQQQLITTGVIDATTSIRDFRDTAVVIQKLDLIITVDTAIAHLAGALGKPVWMLNYFNSDWRWGLGGQHTRWYPSLRQYRQEQPYDWSAPVTKIIDDLRHYLNGAQPLLFPQPAIEEKTLQNPYALSINLPATP